MTKAVASTPWLGAGQRGDGVEAGSESWHGRGATAPGSGGCRVLCRNVLQLMLCDSLTRPPGQPELTCHLQSCHSPASHGVGCKQAARGTLSPV